MLKLGLIYTAVLKLRMWKALSPERTQYSPGKSYIRNEQRPVGTLPHHHHRGSNALRRIGFDGMAYGNCAPTLVLDLICRRRPQWQAAVSKPFKPISLYVHFNGTGTLFRSTLLCCLTGGISHFAAQSRLSPGVDYTAPLTRTLG